MRTRRVNQRISFRCKAHFSIKRIDDTDLSTNPAAVQICDVSLTGLSFTSHLDLPSDRPDVIYEFDLDYYGTARGHIVWKKHVGDSYQYGVHFDSVQARYMNFLWNFRNDKHMIKQSLRRV